MIHCRSAPLRVMAAIHNPHTTQKMTDRKQVVCRVVGKVQGDDIAENNSNRTISELDLCILVTHYWNFSKCKGHNCAENQSTRPKFELNLHILVTHLCIKFQFKMSICNGENERKLKIIGIFLSPRGINLPKII